MKALRDLAGVGAESAKRFAELGVHSAEDLLEDFPHRYEDLRSPTPAAKLGGHDGEENALGRVLSVRERRARNLAIVEARLQDESGTFTATWFGRVYMLGALKEGMRLFVRGRVQNTLGGPVMNVSTHRVLREGESYRGEVIPIYHAGKALPSRKIRRVVAENLEQLLDLAPEDPLPPALRERLRFPAVRDAYRAIHQPPTPQAALLARERFVYTECLGLALAAESTRRARAAERDAPVMRAAPELLAQFEAELPFALTGAQRRSIGEIWSDMAREAPMNRLLQGDVGSGKTLVAAAAILLAARSGRQSALMAPTELLAAQHAAKLAPLLMPFGIGVEVLIGGQSAKSRAAAQEKLASGQALLAVGTHALFGEQIEFDRLGLAIIDEQHRFGVEQRAKLRQKGAAPHTLHMTATPIPRTLTQTVYADLENSVLDELPPGRTPVRTFLLRTSRLPRAYEFVRGIVQRGGQAYVVAPAIDEVEITGVLAEAERVRANELAGIALGVLHGRMPAREKDRVMQEFARGELAVLLATTVIEVGVDVPNASVMLVLDANRYGLAQLHQLRGRVGRGAAESFCLLIAPDDAGEIERLTFLTESNDGFVIAERDLQLRGPGELAGKRQSGTQKLLHADLIRDIEVYRSAKKDAGAILNRDPDLHLPEHAALRAFAQGEPSTRATLLSS